MLIFKRGDIIVITSCFYKRHKTSNFNGASLSTATNIEVIASKKSEIKVEKKYREEVQLYPDQVSLPIYLKLICSIE